MSDESVTSPMAGLVGAARPSLEPAHYGQRTLLGVELGEEQVARRRLPRGS